MGSTLTAARSYGRALLIVHVGDSRAYLFRSSHRVSRRPWVAQASLGLSTQLPIAGRGVKLAWMRVWRTREFEQQTSRHSYGSVAASIEF